MSKLNFDVKPKLTALRGKLRESFNIHVNSYKLNVITRIKENLLDKMTKYVANGGSETSAYYQRLHRDETRYALMQEGLEASNSFSSANFESYDKALG